VQSSTFNRNQRPVRLSPRKLFYFALQLSLPQSPTSTNKLLALTLMSHSHPTTASSSSPNFQLILNNALDTYKKRTKKDLRTHPLAVQLQSCDSPGAILAVLQLQVQGLDQSRNTDGRWTKWLDPTVNVMYTFSNIIGAGVGLVCFRTFTFSSSLISTWQVFSPASVIFAGVGVLLSVCISLLTLRGPL
jgi:hypothetical protein